MIITNEDNMALMARYPNNYFDLAIVDPPYDYSISKSYYMSTNKTFYGSQQGRQNSPFKIGNSRVNALSEPPKKEYFKELFRVSKNQIICGGNYFDLPKITGWICWDKNNGETTFGDGELFWTSFKQPLRIIKQSNNQGKIIHPTQKNIKLYKKLLLKYAKQGDKILDTHLGSGSIAIACHDYGFDLTACELNKEYFDKAMERLKNHQSQTKLF